MDGIWIDGVVIVLAAVSYVLMPLLAFMIGRQFFLQNHETEQNHEISEAW